MSKQKATVISPTTMDSGQLERIGKVISKITKVDVVVENEVINEMLGGIKVKFGTKEIDLSMDSFIKGFEEEIDE